MCGCGEWYWVNKSGQIQGEDKYVWACEVKCIEIQVVIWDGIGCYDYLNMIDRGCYMGRVLMYLSMKRRVLV